MTSFDAKTRDFVRSLVDDCSSPLDADWIAQIALRLASAQRRIAVQRLLAPVAWHAVPRLTQAWQQATADASSNNRTQQRDAISRQLLSFYASRIEYNFQDSILGDNECIHLTTAAPPLSLAAPQTEHSASSKNAATYDDSGRLLTPECSLDSVSSQDDPSDADKSLANETKRITRVTFTVQPHAQIDSSLACDPAFAPLASGLACECAPSLTTVGRLIFCHESNQHFSEEHTERLTVRVITQLKDASGRLFERSATVFQATDFVLADERAQCSVNAQVLCQWLEAVHMDHRLFSAMLNSTMTDNSNRINKSSAASHDDASHVFSLASRLSDRLIRSVERLRGAIKQEIVKQQSPATKESKARTADDSSDDSSDASHSSSRRAVGSSSQSKRAVARNPFLDTEAGCSDTDASDDARRGSNDEDEESDGSLHESDADFVVDDDEVEFDSDLLPEEADELARHHSKVHHKSKSSQSQVSANTHISSRSRLSKLRDAARTPSPVKESRRTNKSKKAKIATTSESESESEASNSDSKSSAQRRISARNRSARNTAIADHSEHSSSSSSEHGAASIKEQLAATPESSDDDVDMKSSSPSQTSKDSSSPLATASPTSASASVAAIRKRRRAVCETSSEDEQDENATQTQDHAPVTPLAHDAVVSEKRATSPTPVSESPLSISVKKSPQSNSVAAPIVSAVKPVKAHKTHHVELSDSESESEVKPQLVAKSNAASRSAAADSSSESSSDSDSSVDFPFASAEESAIARVNSRTVGSARKANKSAPQATPAKTPTTKPGRSTTKASKPTDKKSTAKAPKERKQNAKSSSSPRQITTILDSPIQSASALVSPQNDDVDMTLVSVESHTIEALIDVDAQDSSESENIVFSQASESAAVVLASTISVSVDVDAGLNVVAPSVRGSIPSSSPRAVPASSDVDVASRSPAKKRRRVEEKAVTASKSRNSAPTAAAAAAPSLAPAAHSALDSSAPFVPPPGANFAVGLDLQSSTKSTNKKMKKRLKKQQQSANQSQSAPASLTPTPVCSTSADKHRPTPPRKIRRKSSQMSDDLNETSHNEMNHQEVPKHSQARTVRSAQHQESQSKNTSETEASSA